MKVDLSQTQTDEIWISLTSLSHWLTAACLALWPSLIQRQKLCLVSSLQHNFVSVSAHFRHRHRPTESKLSAKTLLEQHNLRCTCAQCSWTLADFLDSMSTLIATPLWYSLFFMSRRERASIENSWQLLEVKTHFTAVHESLSARNRSISPLRDVSFSLSLRNTHNPRSQCSKNNSLSRHSDTTWWNRARCVHIWIKSRWFVPKRSRWSSAETGWTKYKFLFESNYTQRFSESKLEWALIQHISVVVVSRISLKKYFSHLSLLSFSALWLAHREKEVIHIANTVYGTNFSVFMLTRVNFHHIHSSRQCVCIEVEGIVEDIRDIRWEWRRERRSWNWKKWEFYVFQHILFHSRCCVK